MEEQNGIQQSLVFVLMFGYNTVIIISDLKNDTAELHWLEH